MNNYGNENNKNIKLQENLETFRTILQNFYGSPEITYINYSGYYRKAKGDFRENLKELHEILLTQDVEQMLVWITEERKKIKIEMNAIEASPVQKVDFRYVHTIILLIVYLHYGAIIKYLESKKNGVQPGYAIEKIDKSCFSELNDFTGEIMLCKMHELGIEIDDDVVFS